MVWSSAFHIRDALLQGNLMRSTLKRVEFQPLRGFPCLKLEPLWHDINLVDRPPFSRFFLKCNIHAYFLRHGDTSRQNWKNANIMMSSKDWWVQKLAIKICLTFVFHGPTFWKNVCFFSGTKNHFEPQTWRNSHVSSIRGVEWREFRSKTYTWPVILKSTQPKVEITVHEITIPNDRCHSMTRSESLNEDVCRISTFRI